MQPRRLLSMIPHGSRYRRISELASNRAYFQASFRVALFFLAFFVLEFVATAQENSRKPATYMGRRIADYMRFEGDGGPWLLRESRQAEENSSLMVEQLGLKPGMNICDLGCGNGYYTLFMATKVAPAGKVYAVDIQAEMLHNLTERAKVEKVTNIETIQSSPTDPMLPEGKIDLVLMVDVYHEFSDPATMLAAIKKSLSPEGVVALVEFRAEDPRVAIKPLHKMTKKQILKEYKANGFRLVREFDGLPIQHLMFFGADSGESPQKGSP